jgi:TonB family protein
VNSDLTVSFTSPILDESQPMTHARRHRRVNEATIWAALGTALLVHGTVVASVHAFGLDVASDGFTANVTPQHVAQLEVEDLKTTCVGDAVLRASARGAMCLAPWRGGDIEACSNDVQMDLWMDLSACQAGPASASAPIALLEPRAAAKLKPIDPERLLEEMQQEQLKPPPTPPIPPPTPAAAPPPPPPPAPSRPQQVVETAKPNTEKEPENARLLSEYNINVEKQKVARGAVNEPMVAKSKPEELQAKKDPKEAEIKEQKPDRDPGKDQKAPDVPGTLAMRTPGAQQPAEVKQDAMSRGAVTGEKGPIVADGFVPRRGDGAIEQQKHDPGELSRGQSGAGGGAPPLDLKPSKDVLERALGGGSVDHLEEVENGDETALSAKRWVYASFFNRLKRQVAQNWDPGTVWRRNDPNGTVYGFKTRITEVRVSLSPKGELAKIVVTHPSGVGELDDEAVRAFHASAPFPNPPEGLVGAKDHLITFAFSFYFDIGAPRSSWRVVRSM